MKRILVASDLSIRSDRAISRAVRLAARLKVGLTALHVVDSAMPSDLAEMVNAEAKTKLDRFVASQPGADSIDYEVASIVGDPVQTIHDAVADRDADLLVLGVHRSRTFFDTIRETTMERLVRTSAKPTLLVTDAGDHDLDKVLAGVDMSPGCARAIKAAKTLVPAAEFALFHALHVPFKGLTGDAGSAERMQPYVDEAEREVDDWIAACAIPATIPRPQIIEGTPFEALSKTMRAFQPDLLVIGVHSRAGIGRWILGSVAADLIRDPPCDLLVAR